MKKLAHTFAALILVSSVFAISVSAATYYKDWDLSASYADRTDATNRSMFMTYDIGSLAPYDDVWADTAVAAASGMSGVAYTHITGINDAKGSNTGSTITGGFIYSGRAQLAGVDYAKNLEHFGRRTLSNGSSENWDYFIS